MTLLYIFFMRNLAKLIRDTFSDAKASDKSRKPSVRTVKEERFLIKTAKKGVFGGTNNHLWFQVLEGEDSGMRVSVPLFHKEYDRDIESKLDSLDDGDIVVASMRREGRDSKWRITEVREQSI
jgi:hypothetical protein